MVNFTSALQKIGHALATGLQVLTGFAPSIQLLQPKAGAPLQVISKDLTEMLKIVASAEVLLVHNPALSLDDLLAFEAVQIKQIVLASAAVAGKPVQDPSLIEAACQDFANGCAKILKALHPDAVQTTPSEDLVKQG